MESQGKVEKSQGKVREFRAKHLADTLYSLVITFHRHTKYLSILWAPIMFMRKIEFKHYAQTPSSLVW